MRVARKLLPTLALLVAACVDAPTALAPFDELPEVMPQFSVTVLDITALGTERALDVNELGQIVGETMFPSGRRAYLWENGTIRNLGTLGGDGSGASGVNVHGHVVGTSFAPGVGRAFVWRNGIMEDLGTLPGGGNSAGTDINDRGQITGFSFDAASNLRGFLWENGVMRDLGTLGGPHSNAAEINDVGQIVGASTNVAGDSRAFLWENGVMRDLGTLGGSTSTGRGINDLGQVVGSSFDASGDDHAFLWENGIMRDLGTLGGSRSIAHAINELGQVVGLSETNTLERRAFLWEDGVMYDLGTLPGPTGSVAVSINNRGEVVGVSGLDAPLAAEAVRWIVPILAAIQISPSPIRLSKGPSSVDVTVFSSPWFDATRIDPATTTLGNDDGLETPVDRKKKGDVMAAYRDVDRDGDTDLVLTFDRNALMANGDLNAMTTKLTLLGRRVDGRHIRGSAPVAVQ